MMTNAFKTVVVGTDPLASDVNQLVGAFQGINDIGMLKLASYQTSPNAPTVAQGTTSGNLNGTYDWVVVLITGWQQSDGTYYVSGFAPSAASASVSITNNVGSLTEIATGGNPVIGRAIYRTAAGGAAGTEKFVDVIWDNATTSWTDNVADANLGTGMPSVNGTPIPANVPTANTTGTYFEDIKQRGNNAKWYGASGSAQSTTGSINSGSNSLTVASAIDFKVGQGIYVTNAATSTTPLITHITAISGTTITLADNAGATASSVNVYHDDSKAIIATINDLDPVVGGVVLLPPGVCRISSTLPQKSVPVAIKGVGWNDSPSPNQGGTVLVWQGASNSSVIKPGNFYQLENFIIENPNNISGLVGIDMWATTSAPVANVTIRRVVVDGLQTGFQFQNTWYNSLYDCYAEHCTDGFKIGDSCNNTNFYSCHALRNSYGVNVYAQSNQGGFYGCTFEHNSVIALNLVNLPYNWSFVDTYFEYNNQTAVMDGIGIVINNAFVNHDVPPSGKSCFEITAQDVPIELKNIRFSGDIPTAQQFDYTGSTSSSNGSLVIGNTYHKGGLAQLLINHPVLLTANIIDIDRSDIVMVESDLIDGSSAVNRYLIAPGDLRRLDNRTLVAVYVVVYETLTNAMTVNFGDAGASYNDIVSQSLSASQAPGLYSMTLLKNPTLYPSTENYMINNTSAGGGKYKMVLVAS